MCCEENQDFHRNFKSETLTETEFALHVPHDGKQLVRDGKYDENQSLA